MPNIYTAHFKHNREVQILCYVASAVGRPVPNVPFSVMTGADVNAVSKYARAAGIWADQYFSQLDLVVDID